MREILHTDKLPLGMTVAIGDAIYTGTKENEHYAKEEFSIDPSFEEQNVGSKTQNTDKTNESVDLIVLISKLVKKDVETEKATSRQRDDLQLNMKNV